MSSTRRKDLGLGKTATGGSRGSFASHERGTAAPPLATSPDAPEAVTSDPFTVQWVESGVLPTPRHRKPRNVERSFEMCAEVRSVSREDTGEAFTMQEFAGGSGDLDFEVRHYDGELYRPMVAGDIWSYSNRFSEPPYPTPDHRLEATPELIRERLTRLEGDYETGEIQHTTRPYQGKGGDSEAGAREAVQDQIDRYLVVDGELWRKTGEPMYRINTFGLGGNHGGTSFSVAPSSGQMTPGGDDGLIRQDNLYTLDEFKEAQAYALEMARDRGDTESIRGINRVQPIVVPKDRPWTHPKAATRIGEYTRPHNIPWEQLDDFQTQQKALVGLKQQIASHAPHAIYRDADGTQRVDLAQLTEGVEADYLKLSQKVRELRTLDDEF